MMLFRFALGLALALGGQVASGQTPPRQEAREQKLQRMLSVSTDAEQKIAPMHALLKSADFTGEIAISNGKSIDSGKFNRDKDAIPDRAPYASLWRWALRGCSEPIRLVERRGGIGGIQVRNFIVPERNVALAIFSDKGEGDFEFGEVWQKAGFSYDVLSLALCGTAGVHS